MNNQLFIRAKKIEKEIEEIKKKNIELKKQIDILWTASKVEVVAQPFINPDEDDMSFLMDSHKPLVLSIDRYVIANYLKLILRDNEHEIEQLQEEFKAL